ncbi:hypothetical protein DSM43518_04791 [Mycobacterium marinum]|nr:hypothetical protein CCUG20998_03853 [Mycobacterium marinum]RFZ02804.1 hypothetical protein DSM43518_04791 [Mycobacterium marinum]RFZ25995.1 hypothetical protein DSM43519_01309 [Mycobacterium marinum]RFZ28874.1 hypothetical protein DSM44344_01141 [Mycobacterium marinum]RFZ39060.1 hypothetical protein NCTC2275_00328 [Mycobacterium marinum]
MLDDHPAVELGEDPPALPLAILDFHAENFTPVVRMRPTVNSHKLNLAGTLRIVQPQPFKLPKINSPNVNGKAGLVDVVQTMNQVARFDAMVHGLLQIRETDLHVDLPIRLVITQSGDLAPEILNRMDTVFPDRLNRYCDFIADQHQTYQGRMRRVRAVIAHEATVFPVGPIPRERNTARQLNDIDVIS